MTLASRILAVPLRKLEELGPSRLNVTLMNDQSYLGLVMPPAPSAAVPVETEELAVAMA